MEDLLEKVAVVKEAPKDTPNVFLYDPDVNSVQKMFGIDEKGNHYPLTFDKYIPEKSILELRTAPSIKAYYAPLEKPVDIINAVKALKKYGFGSVEKPVLLTFITPKEKDSRISKGEKIITPQELSNK